MQPTGERCRATYQACSLRRWQLQTCCGCMDDYLTRQLNKVLWSDRLDAVEHVLMLFSRIKRKFISPKEANDLRIAGTKFFDKYGVSLAEVEQPWRLAMEWRSKRISLVYLQGNLHGVIDLVDWQRLSGLETAVATEPGFAMVKLAAGVTITAAIASSLARQLCHES